MSSTEEATTRCGLLDRSREATEPLASSPLKNVPLMAEDGARLRGSLS